MVLTRSASTVLGKRTHQSEPDGRNKAAFGKSNQPVSPEADTKKTKRTRTLEEDCDARANKENIPPDNSSTDPTIRTPSLRRTATEANLPTPRSIRSIPRRTASTSKISTPSRSFSTLTITPPPSPPRLLQPIYVRVRSSLRPTCDSSHNQVKGRDEERNILSQFLSAFAEGSQRAGSLYVSGSPGTGKTALVHEVVREFSTDGALEVVYINCMGLKDMGNMYERLIDELPTQLQKKGKRTRGRAGVQQVFEGLKTKCVLVLDELDYLVSTSSALSSIFSLPQANASKLCMIGIANTHTLTSSLPITEVDAVQTLHFKSYTPAELVQIIDCRLSSLHSDPSLSESMKSLLPASAMLLLAKKVASQTGDVRLLFEVLRGAIDRAVTAASEGVDPLNTPAPVVTPVDVLAALKASTSGPSNGVSASSPGGSALMTKVQELGFQPQLVLLVIILAFKRVEAGASLPTTPTKNHAIHSGSQSSTSIDAIQLHSYYAAILNRASEDTFSPVSLSDFMDILGLLEGVGLVRLASESSATPSRSSGSPSPSKRRKTLSRTTSLSSGMMNRTQDVCIAEGIRIEEALRGLGIDVDDKAKSADDMDVRKEEVRLLWHQECCRLSREMKARAQELIAKGDAGVAFEGARRSC